MAVTSPESALGHGRRRGWGKSDETLTLSAMMESGRPEGAWLRHNLEKSFSTAGGNSSRRTSAPVLVRPN